MAQAAVKKNTKPVGFEPTLPYLLFQLPLYAKVRLEDEIDLGMMQQLLNPGDPFDGPCPACQKDTTYRAHSALTNFSGIIDSDELLDNRRFEVIVRCGRDIAKHAWIFNFNIQNKVMVKYGQIPSVADFTATTLNKQFERILGHQRSEELSKGIIQSAHGFGVGAFIYLRRVFEGVLADHAARAATAGQLDPGYDGFRIEDKILALKDRLPRFLVEKRAMYTYLSKGA